MRLAAPDAHWCKPPNMDPEGTRAYRASIVSFSRPDEMLDLAREAGLSHAGHIGPDEIVTRYFAGRSDGLKPAKGESFLIATV